MSNVKISNFTPQTNVRLLDGFAAYEGTVNKKISGSQLVTSVINSNNSGTPSTATIGRVAFYGIGGDSLGGSGSLTWDNPNSTLIIGNSSFEGALDIFGNYATGNTQPAITFHGGDSASANDFDFIIKTQPDGADQTWLLPKSLPSNNQFLKVSNVTVNDVELEWADTGSPWSLSGSNVYYNSGSMSVGIINPNASAIVQFNSTTKGFLPPRMTEAQMNAISSPTEGLMVFDTTNKQWKGYDGTSWVIIG